MELGYAIALPTGKKLGGGFTETRPIRDFPGAPGVKNLPCMSKHVISFVLGFLIHFRCPITNSRNDDDGDGDGLIMVLQSFPLASERSDCHLRCVLGQHVKCYVARTAPKCPSCPHPLQSHSARR